MAIKALLGPGTPHPTLQRALLAGGAGQALAALLPAAGAPEKRKELLGLDSQELMQRVGRKGGGAGFLGRGGRSTGCIALHSATGILP